MSEWGLMLLCAIQSLVIIIMSRCDVPEDSVKEAKYIAYASLVVLVIYVLTEVLNIHIHIKVTPL